MKRILRSAQINDPRSSFHGSVQDLLLENGHIAKIDENIVSEGAMIVDCTGKTLSPGWFDIGVYHGKPGYEYREDNQSLIKAAKAGGYTGVAVWPDTDPYIDQAHTAKSVYQGIDSGFEILPIASPTRQADPYLLSEMYDIHQETKIAGFGLGAKTIDDPALLLRILEYLKPLPGAYLVQNLREPRLVPDAQINEGESQVLLGIKGIPVQEEWIRVHRDSLLADFSGSRLLLHGITQPESLDQLGASQDKNQVHTGVAILNLCYSDQALSTMDSHLKVLPPLRNENAVHSLRKAVIAGQIDYLYTNHHPLEVERKSMSFGDADFGASMIDIAFPLLNTALGDAWSEESLAQLLSINPREYCNCQTDPIETGAYVNLTLYDRESPYSLSRTLSKSSNYPPLPDVLKGRVHATLVGEEHIVGLS